MYKPINDQTTIDAKIHHFIERKAAQSPWGTFKNTITQWRLSDTNVQKPAKTDIAYEALDWSRTTVSHSGYRKLAH